MAIMNADKIANTFNVIWQITNACNYTCDSCDASNRTDNCVYMRERIMTMARKLVLKPRSLYNITLAGGEPALHPFTRDVITYFLNSGRNVAITLETNGSQPFEWYLGLSGRLARANIKISVNIHPQYVTPENILIFLGKIYEAGYQVHVRLHSAREQEIAFWTNLFEKFARVIQLTYDAITRGPGNNPAVDNVEQRQSHWQIGQLNQFGKELVQPGSDDKGFCCQGINYLELLPDGHFKGAPCMNTWLSPEPLWKDGVDIDSILSVSTFNNLCINCMDLYLPKTKSFEATVQIMAAYKEKQKYWEYEIGLLMNETPTHSDLIRARMRRIKPTGVFTGGIEKVQIWKYWTRIVEIYEKLASEESRKTFLSVIKVMETGENAYLCAPHTLTSLTRINPVWAESLPVRLKIPSPISLSELQSYADVLHTALPELEIALPMAVDQFLSQLSWLLASLPGYTLELRLRSSAPVVYASHPDQAGVHPLLRPGAKDPGKDISIIIVASNDQDSIDDTLNSVLMQEEVDFEILVADIASSDATRDILRHYVKLAPDIIRYFRSEKTDANAKLFNQAVRNAQGGAIALLRPGDILKPGILKKALKVLREKCADVVAYGTADIENNAEWQSFLEQPVNAENAQADQWLMAWGAGYNISGLLVSAIFLAHNNILMREMGNLGEIFLGFDIFACNPHLISLPESGVKRHVIRTHVPALADLANALKHMKYLCDKGTITGPVIMPNLLDRIYGLSHGLIGNAASIANPLQSESCSIYAEAFSCCPAYLDRLLVNHLDSNPDLYRNKIPLEPRRSSRFVVQGARLSEYWPYRASPVFSALKPDFSIVITISEPDSGYPNYVKSILCQSLHNFEILIIVDTSPDNIWDELADIADFDHRLRLYSTGRSGSPAVQINLGIEKARGKYLLLLNPGATPGRGFLEQALAAGPDMAVMLHGRPSSTRRTDSTGAAGYRIITERNMNDIGASWTSYELAFKGAIYNSSFLKEANWRQEASGVQRLFRAAIHNAPTIGYRLTDEFEIKGAESDPLIRIDSYLQYYDFAQYTEKGVDRGSLETHIGKYLLPSLETARALTSRLPLNEEDLLQISQNPLLLESILNIISRKPLNATIVRTASFSLLTGGNQPLAYQVDALHAEDKLQAAPDSGFIAFASENRRLDDRELRYARALMNQNKEIDFIWFVRPAGRKEMPEPGLHDGKSLLKMQVDKDALIPFLPDILFKKDRINMQPILNGMPATAFIFVTFASALNVMVVQGGASQAGVPSSSDEFWKNLFESAHALAAFLKERTDFESVEAYWLAQLLYNAPQESVYNYFVRHFKSILERLRNESILAKGVLIWLEWLGAQGGQGIGEIRLLMDAIRNVQ